MERPGTSKLLLNPLDRAAEILFGLIMALTFTCSISIANSRHIEIRQLLVAAIGCNLAWGLVDATMFLLGTLAQKNRSKLIFEAVQNSLEPDEARKYIADSLPPAVGSVIDTDGLEQIRKQFISLPPATGKVRLTVVDLKKAVALFFLMVISTFPVVLPFVFIHDTGIAIRVSNAIAVLMMFLCGWSVGNYVGSSKWRVSIALTVIGIILVILTIILGG